MMETCKNAFAALRPEEKAKRQNNKVTALPRSVAVAQETKSSSGQAKIDWADVNDDDDDYFYDDDEKHLQNGLRNKSNYARSIEASSSAEEVEDSGDDENQTFSEMQDHIAQEKKASLVQAAKAISERERREKEVRDLNAALAELGMATEGSVLSVANLPKSSPPVSSTKKKMKKETKIDDVERNVTFNSNEAKTVVRGLNVAKSPLSSKPEDTPVVDRDEVLKKLRLQNGKIKKSPGKQKTNTIADLPSVRAEAKKKAEGKKLKVKKSEKLPPYQT